MFIGLLSLALLSSPADAKPGERIRTAKNFGLGLGAGTSTGGISGKYFASESLAVQGVLGAGYGNNGTGWDTGVGLGADLLFEMPDFANTEGVDFGWNVGPGVAIMANDAYFGAFLAGVAGLEFNIYAGSVDVVVEYRPRVRVVPSFAVDWFSLSGHIRYYF